MRPLRHLVRTLSSLGSPKIRTILNWPIINGSPRRQRLVSMWSICRNSSTCVFNNDKHVKQASVQSDGSCSLSASVRDISLLWITHGLLLVTDELIRQVAINCAERGLLLLRVRDELQMTLRAYQTLYESSVAFGMRKALMAEQGKSELERKVRSFERQAPIISIPSFFLVDSIGRG